MKISKQQLIEMNASEEFLDRFTKQTGNTKDEVSVDLLISFIGIETKVKDLLWLASETIEKEKIIRFYCDVALIDINLIKPYTKAYDEIVDFLKNPNPNKPKLYSIWILSAVVNAANNAIHAALDVYSDNSFAFGDAKIFASSARAAYTALDTVSACFNVDTSHDAALAAIDVCSKSNASQIEINKLLTTLFEDDNEINKEGTKK